MVVIAIVLLAAGGVEMTRLTPASIPPGIHLLMFFLGLAGLVLAGYVTARTAHSARKLHVIILGSLMMLVGLLAFIRPSAVGPTPNPLMALHWMLTIPLMLLGASLAGDPPA